MSQLSRPYQIALGAILVLALAWFIVLKPGDDAGAALPPDLATAPPATVDPPPPTPSAATGSSGPTAPGAAGLGRAVDKARGAAKTSEKAAATTASVSGDKQRRAASGPTTTSPASGDTAVPETPAQVAPEDPSRAILDDLAAGRVAVVLFHDPDGADDRRVREQLKQVDRLGGKVRVRQIPIARLADYAAITAGVSVAWAPTLLVIGRDRRARALVGYADTMSIQQLIGDVGGPRFVSRRAPR